MGLPLGRRVAIARGAVGQLVVFSPLHLSDQSEAEIKRIGEIAAFVLSSRFHDGFYEEYFSRFRETRFLAGPASLEDHSRWPLTMLQPDLPELEGFSYELLQGMPRVQEHVFLHHASRTLIVADAFFNLPTANKWVIRLLMRAADMGGKPRPSRMFRALIRSRLAFSISLRKVLEWDFDRIVPGHGDVINSGAKEVLQNAFNAYLG